VGAVATADPEGEMVVLVAERTRSNLSIDTDPQQQKAASPRVLVVRSFLR
jgi:hypothetical protein